MSDYIRALNLAFLLLEPKVNVLWMTVFRERCILTGMRIMNRQLEIPGHVILLGRLHKQYCC